MVTRPAVSLAQDRESSLARTGGLTTMLRHQLAVLSPDRFSLAHLEQTLKPNYEAPRRLA